MKAAPPNQSGIASEPTLGVAAQLEERGIVGFWEWDLRSKRMYWSAGVYRITGLDPSDEPSFELFESLVHLEDRLDQSELLKNIDAGLCDCRLIRIVRPHGEMRRVNLRCCRVYENDGSLKKLACILVDETDQTRTHARLQEDGPPGRLPSAVTWTADAMCNIVSAPDWLSLTGFESSSANGKGWLAAVPPDQRMFVEKQFTAAISQNLSFEFIHKIIRSDSSECYVAMRGLPLRDEAGVVRQWIGLFLTSPRPESMHAEGAVLASSSAPLTGAHIRGARGFLGWTALELANNAGVSLSTIRRIEDSPSFPNVRDRAMAAIRAALCQGGVLFWRLPDNQIAICLKAYD